MKLTAKLWIGVAILVILSPLGLMFPEHFKAGSAWGEWGVDEIQKLIGYVPKGLEQFSSFWKAPLPDYAFSGWEEKGLAGLSFAYIISAIIGIAVVVIIALSVGKWLAKKGD
ncbi:MAG: PDGLE domain-containing protein [Candidatus Omnitrophica bacterium]|nr:PDGLE domain-containing protein [Candidatus Omnitrophota bacterium]